MGNGKRTTQSETIMIRVARVASQLLPSVTASIAMVGAMVPAARPRPQMQNTTLLSITHEHDDVYSYRSSCPASLEYRAGQYLHLVAPGARPSSCLRWIYPVEASIKVGSPVSDRATS